MASAQVRAPEQERVLGRELEPALEPEQALERELAPGLAQMSRALGAKRLSANPPT